MCMLLQFDHQVDKPHHHILVKGWCKFLSLSLPKYHLVLNKQCLQVWQTIQTKLHLL
jgi:hypothetical protein